MMAVVEIKSFEVLDPPLRIGTMTLLASFIVQTGAVLLPGFALMRTDFGDVKLLKPRSARAYRLRFVSKDASETLLDLACDKFEATTGISPEDVEVPAVPGARDAIEQMGDRL